jgi:LuxR family transcriptional regulator, maltose regulon positive regulatory protein
MGDLARGDAPVRLALAGARVDPPLQVAAVRAATQVTEIRAANRRFSATEAEDLVNGSLGLGLDSADAELLRAGTEGLAAGLQFAALSARTPRSVTSCSRRRSSIGSALDSATP